MGEKNAPTRSKFETVYFLTIYVPFTKGFIWRGAGLRGRRLSCARDGPMQSVSKRGARAPEESLQEGPGVLHSLVHRHFDTKVRVHDSFLKHLGSEFSFAVQADVQLYAKLDKK